MCGRRSRWTSANPFSALSGLPGLLLLILIPLLLLPLGTLTTLSPVKDFNGHSEHALFGNYLVRGRQTPEETSQAGNSARSNENYRKYSKVSARRFGGYTEAQSNEYRGNLSSQWRLNERTVKGTRKKRRKIRSSADRSYEYLHTPRPTSPECDFSVCRLRALNLTAVRRQFKDAFENSQIYTIAFELVFKDSNQSLLDVQPYMGDVFQGSHWLWARGRIGRSILGLPLDADVLSLHTLSLSRPTITLNIYSDPYRCFVKLSPNCRVRVTQRFLLDEVTRVRQHKHEPRNYVCHQVAHWSETTNAYALRHQCCDSPPDGDTSESDCQIYTQSPAQISGIQTFIYGLAILLTLFSPSLVMRLKLALSYDSATKFFRASLKHGITGQRNYVIRISSRQLINLNDRKPFSLPLALFRFLFHCYGEGRCGVHCWGEWQAQPRLCHKTSTCKTVYMTFWRLFAVLVLYPLVFYLALILYLTRLNFIQSVLELWELYGNKTPTGNLQLDINLIALALLPYLNPFITIWIAFSFICFIYTVFVVSWPANTLENCLLGPRKMKNVKRSAQRSTLLYQSMTRSYKHILHRLAYGDYSTKRHCFRIRLLPWGLRRVLVFIGRLLLQIPVVYIAFTLCRIESRLAMFRQRETEEVNDEMDELTDEMRCPQRVGLSCCKWTVTVLLWSAFIIILFGYSSAVFIVIQFALNLVFFTLLSLVLNSNILLPWACVLGIACFYINDTLLIINREHKEILRLIDENSPRISAIEDTESLFRDTGNQILKSHNLGAVKFIDGDKTEYVSKELYCGVCSDLKCGWSVCIRRILYRSATCITYTFIVFFCLHTFSALFGKSNLVATLLAVFLSFLPKLNHCLTDETEFKTKVATWAKIIPEVLDRHIRVDKEDCLDEAEEALSTYDVRPVGHLEMDAPKMVAYGNLRMWKFPWVVSTEQQSHSTEGFMIALASKLATSAFLSKIVTRQYLPQLHDDHVLRQWCLLIETAITEGCATINSINGLPLESVRLFPKEMQFLVSYFHTGRTIDNVVDNINRELYGPFTKGVLVTIGNTPLAIAKLDNLLFAFNASCHGEQVTDLFGAILIMAEFNIQNLQTIVKFIMDPYSPDTVPVYAMLPMEGFVFQSPDILELESPSVESSLE